MSIIEQTIGRVRSALGWATADRREEAKGKLQELDAEDGDDATTGRSDEQVLDEAELHVRADHADLAPEAEPDDRPPAQPPTAG